MTRCECGAAVIAGLQSPPAHHIDQPLAQGLALQRQLSPLPCIKAGYEFVSKRAEARLREPLSSTLRQLNIRPKSLQSVTQFMERRLQELKFPRKRQTGIAYALLGVLTGTCITAFYSCAFICAWVVMCILVIPSCFLVLHISKEISRTRKPYAEWTEEEFWQHWNLRRHKKRPVPREIHMIAEEVQMELPSSRLTVYYLYEDAFLCARHPSILGADEELYILEHWGTRDFER